MILEKADLYCARSPSAVFFLAMARRAQRSCALATLGLSDLWVMI
jgi:hypothetical protein